MKKILLFIIIVILLSGCVTRKRCERFIPPPVVNTETIIIKKDSLIFVPVPGDTIKDVDTVYVKDGISTMPLKRLDTKYCYALAEIKDNKHYFNLYQKEDSIPKVIEYVDKIVTVKETITVEVERDFTWWEKTYKTIGKFTFWILSTASVLGIAYLFIPIKLPKIKL